MSGRFNKFPYAMVFPKITNITVKNDVLIGSSFKISRGSFSKPRVPSLIP